MINRNQSRLIAQELRNAQRKRRKDVTYGVRVGSQHRMRNEVARGVNPRAADD